MKVLIGSKNPGKIMGAKAAFDLYFNDFDIEGIAVSSDVSDEPVNEDIYIGARNRVNNLIKYASANNVDADYFLGIESGITNLLGKYIIIQIAVIKDRNGYESIGTGPAFPVPDSLVDEIINTDLGKVMDRLFDSKDLSKGKGGINFLTHDVIDRIHLTKEAFIMALTSHLNKEWKD